MFVGEEQKAPQGQLRSAEGQLVPRKPPEVGNPKDNH